MVLTLSISQAKTGAAQAGDPLNRNPRSWEPCKAAVKWGMGSGKDFLLSLIPASTGLPGPVQFWLQRPASPPGEGLHGTPGTSVASTLMRQGWLGGHLKIDLCSQLAEGDRSKVEGFRLARGNEEAEPRMGKVRTGPTRIMTSMHIPREEAATLKELLGVGS